MIDLQTVGMHTRSFRSIEALAQGIWSYGHRWKIPLELVTDGIDSRTIEERFLEVLLPCLQILSNGPNRSYPLNESDPDR